MTSKGRISWQTSVVLDAVRLTAALVVFLHHAYAMWFDDRVAEKLVNLAHFCVVIFFVLSGYLISYTTTNNNRGILKYVQARLSRLYSVLIPALLITAICQLIVFFSNTEMYHLYTRSAITIRYMLVALFVNESWFISSAPPINGPMWSISYEFWYYAIFAVWFYYSDRPKGYLILMLTILLGGPAIILMMPIWLMGLIAYKFKTLLITNASKWTVFIISFVIAVSLNYLLQGFPFKLGQPPFYYANEFVKDSVVGLFVAVAIWSISTLMVSNSEPLSVKKFRKIADLTFPLYLLHFPLLVLFKSLVAFNPNSKGQFGLAAITVLFIIFIIGSFLESRRMWWSNWIGTILEKLYLMLPHKVNSDSNYPG